MKTTVLLATALFLASAPSPDSNSISEMSGGFLLPAKSDALLASQNAPPAKITKIIRKQSIAEQYESIHRTEKDDWASKSTGNIVAGSQ